MATNRYTYSRGTLAGRVLAISLCVLVLPLIFHSLFLYRDEYRLEVEDTRKNLATIGNDRASLMGQIVRLKANMLTVFGEEGSRHAKEFGIETIPLPPSVGTATQFIIANREQNALLVGEKKSATTAFVIAIPFHQFLANFV